MKVQYKLIFLIILFILIGLVLIGDPTDIFYIVLNFSLPVLFIIFKLFFSDVKNRKLFWQKRSPYFGEQRRKINKNILNLFFYNRISMVYVFSLSIPELKKQGT